jgi:hypothetical protein
VDIKIFRVLRIIFLKKFMNFIFKILKKIFKNKIPEIFKNQSLKCPTLGIFDL